MNNFFFVNEVFFINYSFSLVVSLSHSAAGGKPEGVDVTVAGNQ